ncbi:helix-turn-helix domain-containing protein [Clostridium sp. K25]|uniref:helix-turn-helix domain-containing protein n=1 Tax=Clostridium sp. K25 TaxID=1443109 RepID=UPI0004D35AF9|nr:helix-turn-helix transcriptional regulator [Clostridium sp. K25]KEI06189.1 putative transcriptional regulator [Clostridium sp. K25]NFF59824.1 helix-turn-helix transcriptional regulator [Clostridium botulinum]NFL02395.1 helix-turn-helix transcriptional regulator [Clostridium botulinum]
MDNGIRINQLNNFLSNYLIDNDISKSKLQEKSGVTLSTLCNIKNDKRLIRLDTLKALTDALGLEVEIKFNVKNSINKLKK